MLAGLLFLVSEALGAPVTISFSPAAGALTAGSVGVAYKETILVSGGASPYSYAVMSGSLPAGVSLNTSNGTISGMPTNVGNFSFTILVTDSNSAVASAAYSLTVAASKPDAPSIDSVSANDAEAKVFFTAPSSDGGASITSYTVTSNPGGLTQSGSTSPITVTGLTNGTTYTFTVTAANSAGTGPASSPSSPVTPTAPLQRPVASGVSTTVGANSSSNTITLNITGGAASSVSVASTPSHGTATASGTMISYTPTAGYSGTDSFTYTATNPAGTSSPATVSITVSRPTLSMWPTSGASATVPVGTVYSQTIIPGDGTAPYAYSATSGTPAPGLTFNTTTGEIAGTLTTAGSFTATFMATDVYGATGSATYTLNVTAILPGAPVIGSASGGDRQATVSFSPPSSNGGATPTYTVTATPGGITATGSASPITVTGLANGTSYTFKVTATNSAGAGPSSASSNSVTPAAPAPATPAPPLLPPVTGAVSATVAANSASNAIALSLAGDAATSVAVVTAPSHGTATASGLSISYTPAAGYSGPDSFSYTASNGGGTSAPATVSISITAPSFSFSPAAGELAATEAGKPFNQTITASGGTAPYTYAITSGALPAGLSLVTPSGQLAGSPRVPGNYNFTITATDANNAISSAAYSLSVSGRPVVLSFSPLSGALPAAMAGEAYSQPVAASGGSLPIIYSIASGSLPKGLVLNVSTGALNGPLDAASAGDYAFSIQAQDGNGATGTVNYTLKVAARSVTVSDQVVVDVPAGSTPNNIYLNRNATGGPFTSAEILSVEPSAAGTASIIQGELAAVSTSSAPAGWYLKFTPNPAYSGVARVSYRLGSVLGRSNPGAVIYRLNYDAPRVATDIDRLVHDYVRARQAMISSAIQVPGLIERRQMAQATTPVTSRISPSQDGMLLGFSTSLAQLEAARDRADGVSPGYGSPFNVWLDGAFLAHNHKDEGNRWGSFAMLNLGMDYLLNERALLGLSFHYDRMIDPTKQDAKLYGNGWLAGPYASVELMKDIVWDTSLLYGGSSNTIDTPFWDGEFNTRRWLLDTSLKGQWLLDTATTLTPRLRAMYFSEMVEDYAVRNQASSAIGVAGFTSEQLRVSLGAEIARTFTLTNGSVLTPKFGLTAGVSGLDGSGAFGQVTVGASLMTVEAWMMDANLLFNIEGDGEKSIGARLGLTRRF
ncbi:putative Ig domain-containing protein [Rhizobium oryzicola]|uniref:Ig domain-containing protein n=1 Tax=Rhizobium oryzicola TaxID=1232668 RepID=A0ABT8SSP3_9HYPH|nr:putative Ig domain-containing protein [Rhizobium oryzicola]MDO1581089.1 putative Ig domain-containing protein [Rhizobium oryzicola]